MGNIHEQLPNMTDNRGDTAVLMDIVKRADAMGLLAGVRRGPGQNSSERLQLLLSLSACNANGCPLRLADLFLASDLDFTHDVLGIHRHTDRVTGKLTGGFWPRYACPSPATPQPWGEDADGANRHGDDMM